jgi:hypothetical protein
MNNFSARRQLPAAPRKVGSPMPAGSKPLSTVRICWIVACPIAAEEKIRFCQFFLDADDFRFTSPCDGEIDKPTYFARCFGDSGWIKPQNLERIFVEGSGALVTCRFAARDGRSFRNTEFFSFESDRIRRIDVYFGATYQNGAFLRQRIN